MLELEILGNVGADAQKKEIDNKLVINFSIAHSYTYKDKDGKEQTVTEWVECSKWLKKEQEDKFSEHIKKGVKLLVKGTPSADAYISKENNKPVGKLHLNVTSAFLPL